MQIFRQFLKISYVALFSSSLFTLNLFASSNIAESQSTFQNININAGITYQKIEGFGTCLISWGNLPKEIYTKEFVRFYSETAGLNMLRIPLTRFTHKEVQKPDEIKAENIFTDNRSQVFLDFAKELVKVNSDTRFVASVWSGPMWMKMHQGLFNRFGENMAITAQSYEYTKDRGLSSNRIAPDKYRHFARWLVAVVEFHQQHGIEFYALSFANEPRFSQFYASAVWTAEDYAKMLIILNEEMEKSGHGDILLFGPEDMTGHMHEGGTKGMVDAIVSQPEALVALDRWATHGYTDGVHQDISAESSTVFYNYIKHHNKSYWMTEGGTGKHDWPLPLTDGLAMALHNSLAGGHASAFLPWQISDTGATHHNLTVRDEVNHKLASGMHFFRTIPVDAVRIDTSPAFGEVKASAYFRKESSKISIILINPENKAHTVNMSLENLPAIQELRMIRTSESGLFQTVDPVEVKNQKLSVEIPAYSIFSLYR